MGNKLIVTPYCHCAMTASYEGYLSVIKFIYYLHFINTTLFTTEKFISCVIDEKDPFYINKSTS